MNDRPRSGCPRVTDVETDTQIVVNFRDHPFKTVRSAAIETNVSECTMVRRLACAGVKACRPAVKSMLNAQHKLNRMIWAQEHVRWTREQWASVLLSDEATFEVGETGHNVRCYRKSNERYEPNMILEKKNRGYGSVNVSGICAQNETALIRLNGRVTGETYVRDILREQVQPFV